MTDRQAQYKKAFKDQQCNAKSRVIGFELTFDQWMKIWIDSGKLEQRGRHKDGYVMSRFNDQGPYAVDNVVIQTLSENSKSVNHKRDQPKARSHYLKLNTKAQRNYIARNSKKEQNATTNKQELENITL